MPGPEPILIRQPLLVGHQRIDGLWFAAERFDENARGQLILAHWQTGARAWRFAEGDLLRFASAHAVQCEAQTGWPLQRQGRALCSAVLSEQERQQLPDADLWLVRGGRVIALHVADAERLAPGQWLDVSGLALLDTYDCRDTLPEPELRPLAVSRDAREILGDALAPVSPEREAVMQALRERRQYAGQGGQGTDSKGTDSKGSLLERLGAWFSVFAAATGSATAPGKAAPRGQAAPQGQVAPRGQAARPKPARWRRWLSQLTRQSRLSRLYGKRQGAYMQRMLEMFENGELHEALRHAIPLSEGQGSEEQAFGTPQRRDQLTINQRIEAGRSMLFEDDLQAHLREVYRRSFERLDREGRIDEAVFVLAELLKARQEALDYLEKHQRLRQAADFALGWDMPAAVIVRLLIKADDWQRALLVARRDDAFDEAVSGLQAQWPEQAARLRLEWALALAGKGLWLRAVEIIWSLPAERERAAQWLLAVEAAGGQLGMGAMVKRAILLPDSQSLHDCQVTLERLRNDPQGLAERAELARHLLRHKDQGRSLTWMSRAVLPALLADQAGERGRLTAKELQALLSMSGDKLLQADLPGRMPERATPASLKSLVPTQVWSAPLPGSRAIVDAVALPDARYLLALGEAGATLVDAGGQRLAHFAVPAEALVIAHSGQMALALARRGEVWRVSKLDLVHRTASDLGVLMFDVFARSFDGTGWTLGRGNQLRVVDVDRDFATLWHVGDLPGRVVSLNASAQHECLWLMNERGASQLWHYVLPGRRLASRDEVPRTEHEHGWQVFGAHGEVAEFRLKRTPGDEPILVQESRAGRRGYRLPGLDEHAQLDNDGLILQLCEQWLVVGYLLAAGGRRWHFIHRPSERCCVQIEWPEDQVQLRRGGADWLLFDSQGRLSHVCAEDAVERSLSLN